MINSIKNLFPIITIIIRIIIRITIRIIITIIIRIIIRIGKSFFAIEIFVGAIFLPLFFALGCETANKKKKLPAI